MTNATYTWKSHINEIEAALEPLWNHLSSSTRWAHISKQIHVLLKSNMQYYNW